MGNLFEGYSVLHSKSRRQVANAKDGRIDIPSAADQAVWGSVVTPSQQGPSEVPAENKFWRILNLKVTERFFMHLYADALSSSNSVS